VGQISIEFSLGLLLVSFDGDEAVLVTLDWLHPAISKLKDVAVNISAWLNLKFIIQISFRS